MGQLADRLAYLATRYGSDAAAWQHEIHAVAALEEGDPRLALERFHLLKRRFAEFRRAQLLRELRAFDFVRGIPPLDTKGWEAKEIEADIRAATRALSLARGIERAREEMREAVAGLRVRRAQTADPVVPAAWNDLAPLAARVEEARRRVAREGRLDRRLADAQRRARHLSRPPALPDATLAPGALDEALDAVEPRLKALELVEDSLAKALDPLKSPEVATYRGESRRALEREARRLAEAEDAAGLEALLGRAEALRREAAGLASKASRSKRKGLAPPERERRAGDTMDGYG